MTVIPSENMEEIRRIARKKLPDDARPDFQPANRWYKIQLDIAEPDITERENAEMLADAYRAAGYKVSTLPGTVKVTKSGLNWPDTDTTE